MIINSYFEDFSRFNVGWVISVRRYFLILKLFANVYYFQVSVNSGVCISELLSTKCSPPSNTINIKSTDVLKCSKSLLRM